MGPRHLQRDTSLTSLSVRLGTLPKSPDTGKGGHRIEEREKLSIFLNSPMNGPLLGPQALLGELENPVTQLASPIFPQTPGLKD